MHVTEPHQDTEVDQADSKHAGVYWLLAYMVLMVYNKKKRQKLVLIVLKQEKET